MSSAGDIATPFDTLALGRSVRLGELYDARSANFLGVQLYDEATMKKKTHSLDIKSTDLLLTKSNSFEERASVLDIKGELSVEVLGGIVKVSGSATYLKDKSSNTRESAWAMSLKMRLTEKRLLFAEEDLWLHALESVRLEHIAKRRATHFVSSIRFGGDVVVSLVARSSKVSDEEIISGKLEARLDLLKGVVNLEAEVEAGVKAQFNDIKDKFDVEMHGDMDLETVPVDPAGVLDAFRDARRLLGDGVPISITLQPIPEKLTEESIILHNLDKQRLRDILQAFGNLDDVRSRFQVLLTSVKAYKDTVPELALAINNAASEFANKSELLSQKLTDALGAFRKDGSESGWGFIQEARSLFNEHVQAVEGYQAPEYPDKLAGLELAYADFGEFVTLMGALKFPLSVIRDVVRSTYKNNTMAVCLMPPLNGSTVTISKFSALAAKAHNYCSDQVVPIPDYFLYLERPSILEKRLPNNGAFSKTTEPSLFLATKAESGIISWRLVPFAELSSPKRVYEFNLRYGRAWFSDSRFMVHDFQPFTANAPFTFVGRATYHNPPSATPYSTFLQLHAGGKSKIQLRRRNTDGALDVHYTDVKGQSVSLAQSAPDKLQDGIPFTAAFLQDGAAKKWRFYVNGKMVGESAIQQTIGSTVSFVHIGDIKGDQWSGMIDAIQVYSGMLTPAEIKLASTLPSGLLFENKEKIAIVEGLLAETATSDTPTAELKEAPDHEESVQPSAA